MVSTDLLLFADIEEELPVPNLEKLKPEIEKHVDAFLNQKLREVFPILSKFIGVKTTNQLKDSFLLERIQPSAISNQLSEEISRCT